MKEALLMGILAMSANTDDNEINITQVSTPVTVTQNGQKVTVLRQNYVYSVTAEDNKPAIGPQIIRHVVYPI